MEKIHYGTCWTGGKELKYYSSKEEFFGFNVLTTEVYTDGFNDKDDHTFIEFEDQGGTRWEIIVETNNEITTIKEPKKVTLNFTGSSELDTFIQSLEFAARELRKQSERNADFRRSLTKEKSQ